MNRSTLEWYEQIARGLIWAAGVVLVLAVLGAILIAGSDEALPLFEDVERQGRGVASLASLAWGVTAAGILLGLGAILRLMVSDRLERLGPAPQPAAERAAPGPKRAAPGPKQGATAAKRAALAEDRATPAAERDEPATPKRPARPRRGDAERE